MAHVEKTIQVNVPIHTVYNQWTQFEQFPQFMQGVKEVKQLDDAHLHWKAEIAGKNEEWDAEITAQEPDKRVAWRSISGSPNAGTVTFRPVSDDTTEVQLNMEYDPKGFVESAGDALGVVSSRVTGDLNRFKEFIESRGQETGAWRGSIQGGNVH